MRCFTWTDIHIGKNAEGPLPYTGARHACVWCRPISYLSPLLAVVVGVVHAGLSPVIIVAGVKPNLLLVAVVLVTCLVGVMPGITWAFFGGLTANLLVGEPLGAIPLILLTASALVAGGARIFGSLVWVFPVVAAFAGSIVADIGSLVISQLVTDAVAATPPFGILLAAATLNAAIAALLLYPARALVERYGPEESPAW